MNSSYQDVIISLSLIIICWPREASAENHLIPPICLSLEPVMTCEKAIYVSLRAVRIMCVTVCKPKRTLLFFGEKRSTNEINNQRRSQSCFYFSAEWFWLSVRLILIHTLSVFWCSSQGNLDLTNTMLHFSRMQLQFWF